MATEANVALALLQTCPVRWLELDARRLPPSKKSLVLEMTITVF